MASVDHSLSSLNIHQEENVKLERSLLKDLAADALRDYISTGRIPEGTRLTEREVSQMLGISRMPAHDALMILETEGLVVRQGGARYVISLTEKDVRDLHVARRVLEKEATILATQNLTDDNKAELYEKLAALEEAATSGDRHLAARCDMALHQKIWELAENRYLQELLNSLVGVIFVLNDRVRIYSQRSARDPVGEHRDLVELMVSGDDVGAGEKMAAHLTNAIAESLQTFRMVGVDGTSDTSDPA